MKVRIEFFEESFFLGQKIEMSFLENKTFELWNKFMKGRKTIQNTIGNELYSFEIYSKGFFQDFNPAKSFEKWAAVEVSNYENVSEDFEKLIVPSGKYAVFIHKGPASEGPKTYDYIFKTWLPNSNFKLDARPHFAKMGEKYKNDSPDSEEEIWLPIID